MVIRVRKQGKSGRVLVGARVVLIGLALGFAALAVGALLAASTTIQPDQFIAYVLLPLTLALALVLVTLRSDGLPVNLSLSIVSSAVVLLVCEVGLGLVSTDDPGPRVAEDAGRSWDGRTQLEVIDSLKNTGLRAFPSLPATVARRITIADEDEMLRPLAPGVSGATIVVCNESGVWMTFEADEHGFNNPTGVWNEAPVEIAVIGDSYIYGQCVIRGETIPDRLREKWPFVVNLGIPAAGPLTEFAILKEYGPVLQPRIVLWMFTEENDAENLFTESSDPLLRQPSKWISQSLVNRQAVLDAGVSRWLDSAIAVETDRPQAQKPRRSLTEVLRLPLLRRLGGMYIPFPRTVHRLPGFHSIIAQADELTRSWEGRLVLVYMPRRDRYDGPLKRPSLELGEVFKVADELGIPLVDLDSIIRTQSDPRSLWVHPRGHLNARGYQVVGQALLGALESLRTDRVQGPENPS